MTVVSNTSPITHNYKPGHGTIKVICLSEISLMPCPYATTL
ncbi:hypothetical protein [Microseira wollei]|nr:hypothetical protein [Microseira wollei]